MSGYGHGKAMPKRKKMIDFGHGIGIAKKTIDFGHGKGTLKKQISEFGHGKIQMTEIKMIDFGLGKETLKKIPQARKPKTTSPGVRRQHLKAIAVFLRSFLEQRDVEQLGGLKRQTRCNFRKQETKNDFKMFNKVQRGVKTYTVVLHCLLTCPLINLKFV